MLHEGLRRLFRLTGQPCFQIYGRASWETDWSIIDVYATRRRDSDSRWLLWRGTCITWSASVIAVGSDFARELLLEQQDAPASREVPVCVAGGRLNNPVRRMESDGDPFPSCSEILAHECGHTGQARLLGPIYWPLGATVTRCREGPHVWNRFENQASEVGQFGGLVAGSLRPQAIPPGPG